ncbi:hypothetical protein N9C56_15420 [Paracoccaceae bacterium]|nr:hypothetical protein [Paracoccaceae bacterium]
MACPLALLAGNASRPRAWLNKYVWRELAAELSLPVFVTMPNIRRLIDELSSAGMTNCGTKYR